MSTGSSDEVDDCDALLATEADCALKAVSSRVRRLTYMISASILRHAFDLCLSHVRTTASCSFSHSRYSSAAVNGRGCRSGTPGGSLVIAIGLTGPRCACVEGPLVAGSGGGAMVCEARREAVVDVDCMTGERVCCWRGERGDCGRELMSGAIWQGEQAGLLIVTVWQAQGKNVDLCFSQTRKLVLILAAYVTGLSRHFIG